MNIDTIICGDNATVLQSFPDECIDLTVTSPPYDDMDFDYNPISKGGLRVYNGYSWNFKELARQLYRVTKPGGVVVWVVNDPTINGSESLATSLQKIYFRKTGFNIHDTMLYKTNKPPLTHNRYEQEFEYMFVLSRGAPAVFNPIKVRTNWGGTGTQATFRQDASGRQERAHNKKLVAEQKIKGNVWHVPSGNGKGTADDYIFAHPATFPESLARDHILSWSNPGDLVLDPFIGSGTTAKMAKETGRHWIGIDISNEYCNLSRRRMAGANVPLFQVQP